MKARQRSRIDFGAINSANIMFLPTNNIVNSRWKNAGKRGFYRREDRCDAQSSETRVNRRNSVKFDEKIS